MIVHLSLTLVEWTHWGKTLSRSNKARLKYCLMWGRVEPSTEPSNTRAALRTGGKDECRGELFVEILNM